MAECSRSLGLHRVFYSTADGGFHHCCFPCKYHSKVIKVGKWSCILQLFEIPFYPSTKKRCRNGWVYLLRYFFLDPCILVFASERTRTLFIIGGRRRCNALHSRFIAMAFLFAWVPINLGNGFTEHGNKQRTQLKFTNTDWNCMKLYQLLVFLQIFIVIRHRRLSVIKNWPALVS